MVHNNQIDRDGKPHWEHTERVASKMPTAFLATCAYLHDVLEDTNVSKEDLACLFGWNVVHVVDLLSHRESDSWRQYIERVLQSPSSVIIKIADIEDNLARADEKMEARRAMYEYTLFELKEIKEKYDIFFLSESCT